jgi:hypothetical protein
MNADDFTAENARNAEKIFALFAIFAVKNPNADERG